MAFFPLSEFERISAEPKLPHRFTSENRPDPMLTQSLELKRLQVAQNLTFKFFGVCLCDLRVSKFHLTVISTMSRK